MKKVRRHFTALLILTFLTCIGLSLVVAGSLQRLFLQPALLSVSYSAPPLVSAQSVVITDELTGQVLYAKQPDKVLPIASVTKLFSTSLFFKQAAPAATTSITWSDVNVEGRAGRLKVGQVYTNHDLLFPALLESSNDAAAALARIDADLLEVMNDYATEHGALQTRFVDTSGLSDENVSTAAELSILFASVVKDFPHIIDITTLKNHLNHINAWLNNNPFVNDDGYAGGKHGFTYAANRTAVARFHEPFIAGKRSIDYVILGSDDLVSDMKVLRNFVHSTVSYQ